MTERGQLGLALADFKVMTSSFGRLIVWVQTPTWKG